MNFQYALQFMNQLRQNVSDPKQAVEEMVRSGKVSEQQVNEAIRLVENLGFKGNDMKGEML